MRSITFALVMTSILPSCQKAAAYDGPVYVALPAPLLKMSRNTEINPHETSIHLSRDKMELIYQFKPAAKAESAQYLYLPIAPFDSDYADNKSAFSGDLASDPLGVNATFNAVPIDFKAVARASYLGVDLTGDLKNAGIPLAPFGNATAAAINTLSGALRADFTERGIISQWGPLWTLETTYVARQVFQPGQPSELKISYRPIIGTYVESIVQIGGKLVYGLDAEKLDFLCLKPDQLAVIRKRFRARKNEKPYRPYKIHNISMKLENANPQYGSISGLTFIVDINKPADILASCGGKFVRSGPLQYVWKEDFAEEVPELKLFFLQAVEGDSPDDP